MPHPPLKFVHANIGQSDEERFIILYTWRGILVGSTSIYCSSCLIMLMSMQDFIHVIFIGGGGGGSMSQSYDKTPPSLRGIPPPENF